MKQKLFSILALLLMAATGAMAQTYTVTLKSGTEDATNWSITPASAAEGETVTITYSGEKRVKRVKAVKVDPSVIGVTTFSELQTALSAGKDVKLMNDIECTAEIEITSDGALTIDGNGKKLSTTSEIRAFKVESSATVAFKNLTLTGFVSEGGPAINNSGTIVLDGCTISNCHVNIDYSSDGGGAIENKSSGKLYAINTTFSGNYSGEIGGAINNYRGSLYMSGCTFNNNYTTESDAYYGGAIGINGGDEVRLINCTFSGNKYGTTPGTNDIGVFNKPENYTIAGCTGATIASSVGDITTNTTGTATLDYSDLSHISFTYTAEGSASTPLDNTTTAWTAGTFAVPAGGLTYSDAITVSGDVTLVLTDGETLTLNKGISLADGATLTIQGNGTMNVNGSDNSTASTVAGTGTLVLTSGTLTAKGGNGAGYGDNEMQTSGSRPAGGVAINGAVTVSGGTLTATGGAGGSIGSMDFGATAGAGGAAISGSVTLVSGTLTATGGNGGNGGQFSDGNAGAGGAAIGGDLTVNGGTMTTTNGSNGVETVAPTNVNLGAGGKAVAGTVTDNR